MRDYFLLATHTLPQQQLICCLDLDVDRCARCDTVETNVKIYTSIQSEQALRQLLAGDHKLIAQPIN